MCENVRAYMGKNSCVCRWLLSHSQHRAQVRVERMQGVDPRELGQDLVQPLGKVRRGVLDLPRVKGPDALDRVAAGKKKSVRCQYSRKIQLKKTKPEDVGEKKQTKNTKHGFRITNNSKRTRVRILKKVRKMTQRKSRMK
jgi:hypothetical protein